MQLSGSQQATDPRLDTPKQPIDSGCK